MQRREPRKKEDAMSKRKPSFNTIYISERVQECLCPIARCALTTVVAPMGYGKTTAINWFLAEKTKGGKAVAIRMSIYLSLIHICTSHASPPQERDSSSTTSSVPRSKCWSFRSRSNASIWRKGGRLCPPWGIYEFAEDFRVSVMQFTGRTGSCLLYTSRCV